VKRGSYVVIVIWEKGVVPQGGRELIREGEGFLEAGRKECPWLFFGFIDDGRRALIAKVGEEIGGQMSLNSRKK